MDGSGNRGRTPRRKFSAATTTGNASASGTGDSCAAARRQDGEGAAGTEPESRRKQGTRQRRQNVQRVAGRRACCCSLWETWRGGLASSARTASGFWRISPELEPLDGSSTVPPITAATI